MIRLKMRKYNMILTEKQQKNWHYDQVKYEFLTGKEILSSDQKRIIEQKNWRSRGKTNKSTWRAWITVS